MDLLRYYELNDKGKAELKVVNENDLRIFLTTPDSKAELAAVIKKRLFYRYINPFLYDSGEKIFKEDDSEKKAYEKYALLYKNGFSMMANSCLLIENLESFYRGWPKTVGTSEVAFLKFFGRDKNFKEFATNDLASAFYKHIRCGILHQGETTGGWSLTRDEKQLMDLYNKKINSKLFLEKLEKSISDYEMELIEAKWDSVLWNNAKKKLNAIIKNTKFV